MPRALNAAAVPAHARQIVREAFEDLQQIVNPADSENFDKTSLQDVREAIVTIENELAARQSLRNMRRLVPLFTGLEHYSAQMAILCNGTPYLPWVWAPIMLIVRIAVEYVAAFDQIIKAYARIGESLPRIELLDETFKNKDYNQQFQQTLAVFYSDILHFHKNAYKLVRRSGWKILFLSSWGRFGRRFDNIIEDIKRHETLIDQDANALNISEAQKMRQEMRCWRQESLEQISKEEEERTAKEYRAIISWLKMDESEQPAVFQSISAEGTKYPGTCSWILKNENISTWLGTRPDAPFVWLQGSPGTGKSVLSTQLVKFIEASGSVVSYHFSTYAYASSTQYEQILRSLLVQLLRKNDQLISHVYDDCVRGKRSPSAPTLEKQLQVISTSISCDPRKVGYSWIIVDGIDECQQDVQDRFIRLMTRMIFNSISSGSAICKVLISSRASTFLAARLRKTKFVSLAKEKESLNQAIKEYSSQRLCVLHQRLNQLDFQPAHSTQINQLVVQKADGMFLYARLVLDHLATNIFYSVGEIMESVNELPPTLTEFYQKILTQILVHLNPRSVERVKSILGWIAFSKRPLRKLELLSAISFASGNTNVTHLVPGYMLDICSPLLEEHQDGTIAFIHSSVKDFLHTQTNSVQLDERQLVTEHAQAAITCLLSGLAVFQGDRPDQDRCWQVVKGIHAFHLYASQYWVEYLLSIADSGATFERGLPIFDLACRLSDMLNEKTPDSSAGDGKAKVSADGHASPLDRRISLLQASKSLQRAITRSLSARSVKTLRYELARKDQDISIALASESPCPLATVLGQYQKTLRFLLAEHSFPGVSLEDFEYFKSQLQTSAFTCRLGSCTRATVGFENETRQHEHEMTHVQRFLFSCTISDCQYPPFWTNQQLQAHIQRLHVPPKRKTVRLVQGLQFPYTRTTNPKSGLGTTFASQTTFKEPKSSPSQSVLSNHSYLSSPPPSEIVSSPVKAGIAIPTPSPQIGSVPAPPPPPPGQQGPPLPSPPFWLIFALQNLLVQYPHDSYEGTMRFCAVNAETENPVPAPLPGQPIPPNIKFMYLPRILCHDCPGKLFTPGPDTTVLNFEVHLKNRLHREKVDQRVGKPTGRLSSTKAANVLLSWPPTTDIQSTEKVS